MPNSLLFPLITVCVLLGLIFFVWLGMKIEEKTNSLIALVVVSSLIALVLGIVKDLIA